MQKNWKRILAMLLAVLMIVPQFQTVLAAETEEPAASWTELAVEEIDPATLQVPKLGDGQEEDPLVEEDLHDLNETVRVSIFLEEPSTLDKGYSMKNIAANAAAVSYRDGLKSRQAQMQAQIEQKIGHALDVHWNLTLAVNAISADVTYGDIVKIQNIKGVLAVEPENRYEPQVDDAAEPDTANTATSMVGASTAWADGYNGAGSRIAIIDTGLDTTHQSFNADAFNYAITEDGGSYDLLTQTKLTSLRSQLNSGSANYVSAKIPYGYNYVDSNTTINHLSDTQGEHGSHVAGIAAANRYIKSGTSYNDAASTVKAVGMAPDAQLLIMKVFGAKGGAYDSDYMVAIEDAIVLGCDSVNLSLGSGVQGLTYSSAYQSILNKLSNRASNSNMVVAISAGNSYALTQYMDTDLYIDDVSLHTGGSPGTYINSMGTASADNIGQTGTPLTFNGSQEVYYTETSSSGAEMSSIAGTYSYVYIDAPGSASDYRTVNSAVSLSGKVVIVNRGELNFADKGNNAVSYSPKALIVANNESGSISMALDDYTGSFPMVSITLADAETIKANSTQKTTSGITYYTGTVKVTSTVSSGTAGKRENAVISNFSSWGVPGSMLMKPEITAPGGNIYSVYGTNKTSSGTAGGSTKYELMSGTSMAAPHITGLAAVVAQYLRENPPSGKNSALTDKYSNRAIIQSLLMSTATPMKPNGSYLPVLQQGSGLAEVSKAVRSSSVIMMDETEETLTAKTGAAVDGKVKAELGDDPEKTGRYSYSFTIYNLQNKDLAYALNTELFTQDHQEDGGDTFMAETTRTLDADVTYTWEAIGDAPAESHDVNKDGKTDSNDAQAILDSLTGKVEGSTLDVTAGDMDGDGSLTSKDAKLLLEWQPSESGAYADGVVPANGSRKVTVTIQLTDAQKTALDAVYTSGAYVEGFTYINGITTDNEGVKYDDAHSIPILAFYSSWTDPSMFDNTSYVDTVYGTEKTPYSGKTSTNYLVMQYTTGRSTKFTGNPYVVEDTFPADRLALNQNTVLYEIYYNLIRAAGTTGFAATKLNADSDVSAVLKSNLNSTDATAIWYYASAGTWQGTGTQRYQPKLKISTLGLTEGDRFRAGFYALPEYNGMRMSTDMTAANAGHVSDANFKKLLTSNVLGDGALVGYDFVLDNTAPELSAALSADGKTISVTATDNQNLAYVALKSLDGGTTYKEVIPAAPSAQLSISTTGIDGYVAVFAGDYAANEKSVAVQVNDNTNGQDPYTVQSIELNNTSLDLYANASAELSATVYPITVEDRSVRWSSSNTNVATVDADTGLVTAKGSGTATITATSNASSSVKSTCSVAVTSINKSLTGIVWDEDGEIYFSTFNTNNLPNYTKKHNTAITAELTAAFIQNNSSSVKTLYATSFDGSDSTMYTVNASTYALTEVGSVVCPVIDSAAGPTSYARQYGIFTIAYGPYLVLGSASDPTGAYANKDYSSTLGDDVYIAGVAARSLSSTSANYYVLDESGKIYTVALNSTTFGSLSLVMDTGISCSFMYQSLYYDGTYLYWSNYDAGDGVTYMRIINPSTKKIYNAGTFGEGVWPVGGVHVAGSVAPASTEEETERVKKPALIEEIDPEITAKIDQRIRKENRAVRCLDDAADAAGTLHAIRIDNQSTADPEAAESQTDANGSVTLTYSETTPVTNGLVTVSYDPDALTYVGTDSTLTYKSVNVDAAQGTIRFAYAATTAVPAGEAIAVFRFTAACDDTAPVVTTKERNDQLQLNESETVHVSGKGHSWKAPAWTWNGTTSASAAFVCENNSAHTETVAAAITSQTTAATCEAAGKTVYTATVTFEGKTYTDTKEVAIPATGHEYELNGWTWAADYSTASAKFICKNDAAHVQNIEATIETQTTAPGCEAAGQIVYTATVVFEGKTYTDVKTVEKAAVGHDYELSGWTWAEDLTSATATFTCKNDASHVETVAATITSETTAATCEAAGRTVYTATATFEGKTYTDTKEVAIPATGHAYEFNGWTWAEDYSSATAKFVCRNDAAHVQNVEATITAKSEDATCTEPGKVTYTATVVFEGKTYIDEKTVEGAALGHDYELTGWAWAEDYASATATFTCKNDASHVETVDATITSKTTDPTCEETGKTVYTATVTFEGKTYTDTKEAAIPALGHDYELKEWIWTRNYKNATAVFVCKRDGTHVENIVATVTEEITEPTCEADGLTIYTATVEFEGRTYTDKKERTFPALGHDYVIQWSWAEDFSTAKAVFTCQNDASHVISVDAVITKEEVKPDCENDGRTVYTAKVTGPDGKDYTDEQTVVVPATGHAYAFSEWTWSEDHTSAAATFICKNDPTHVLDIDAEITAESQDATCTEAGTVTYTATVVFEGETYKDVQTVEGAALGHDYELKEWIWSKSYHSATAVFVCKRDSSHVERIEAKVVEETTKPTCEEEGKTVYTATVEFEGKTYTDVKETSISALGHAYELTGWTWAEDYSAAAATFTCKNDPTHVETVDAGITSETDAEGNTIYTATVVFEGETYTDTRTVKPETAETELTRIFGRNRYVTAIAAANTLKEMLQVEQFDSAVIAYGGDFPDALTGSYLAAQKHAPILLVTDTNSAKKRVYDYIKANVTADGTIYILGSETVVPADVEETLQGEGFTVKRLAGANRYGTNIAILNEVGIEDGAEVLISVADNYADSLSASSTGKPIILVKDQIRKSQTEFFESLKAKNVKFTILGSEAVIDADLAAAIGAYGEVSRLAGDNRYRTSVEIAKAYFPEAKTAFITTGTDFPDGLCAGPLAYSKGAPVLLVRPGNNEVPAKEWIEELKPTEGYIMGGDNLLDDTVVRNVFSQKADAEIREITVE